MLDESDVRDVLDVALSTGAQWSEIYAERRDATSISIDDHRIEELTSGRDQGAGVRVVKGGQAAYAYTNVLTRESLLEAARSAAAALQGIRAVSVIDLTRVRASVSHAVLRSPSSVSKAEKVAAARRAEEAAWAVSGDVRQVAASYSDVVQHVFLANSFGHLSDETRTRTRLVCQVVAARVEHDGHLARR